jgi:hypothetical protein
LPDNPQREICLASTGTTCQHKQLDRAVTIKIALSDCAQPLSGAEAIETLNLPGIVSSAQKSDIFHVMITRRAPDGVRYAK